MFLFELNLSFYLHIPVDLFIGDDAELVQVLETLMEENEPTTKESETTITGNETMKNTSPTPTVNGTHLFAGALRISLKNCFKRLL